MLILAIDTSCDETSVAVTWNDVMLSNIISSQVELHKTYGGVVPFLAQRAHKERIDVVIQEALRRANAQIKKICHSGLDPESKHKKQTKKSSFGFLFSFLDSPPKAGNDKNVALRHVSADVKTLADKPGDKLILEDIDVFAVTQGPGLAPALEVGIGKAKELALKYKKPLVAVNHTEGHIYASFANKIGRLKTQNLKVKIENYNSPQPPLKIRGGVIAGSDHQGVMGASNFPLLCLLISGGHTELVLMRGHGKYRIVGQTLDDAVGEAFDKVARMLGLGYPGGPIVEWLAREGDPRVHTFPVPLEKSKSCDFSYSGLKTAVLYTVRELEQKKGGLHKQDICDICASFQQVAVAHLVQKTRYAIKKSERPKIHGLLLGGGVVANLHVRKQMRQLAQGYDLPLFYPEIKKLCTDNAAMIAIAAWHRAQQGLFVKNLSRLDRKPIWSL